VNATLYQVPGQWKGRLAIVPRPRGGDWLEDDLRALRDAGVDILVSALTQDEIAELGLEREAETCRTIRIEPMSFPIVDRGVPVSVADMAAVVRQLDQALSTGKTVAVHCRSGIGRSTLVAACLLATAGVPVDGAFAAIEAARGCAVPDTPEQRAWVDRYAIEVGGAAQRAAS
jgi:protein-tyrosine phosphatase